jgi:hypothetical protein
MTRIVMKKITDGIPNLFFEMVFLNVPFGIKNSPAAGDGKLYNRLIEGIFCTFQKYGVLCDTLRASLYFCTVHSVIIMAN